VDSDKREQIRRQVEAVAASIFDSGPFCEPDYLTSERIVEKVDNSWIYDLLDYIRAESVARAGTVWPDFRSAMQQDADQAGFPIELHHRNQNPDGPIDEWLRGAHRGPGNHAVNHPKRRSDVDHGSAWNGWRRRKWTDDWDKDRFKGLPEFVPQRNAVADALSKAPDWQLAVAAVATSIVVVVAVRTGIRYIPPAVLNAMPRILPAGALRAIPRILPRLAPPASPLGSPLFGMPPGQFSL
jgi:hypothetical protein